MNKKNYRDKFQFLDTTHAHKLDEYIKSVCSIMAHIHTHTSLSLSQNVQQTNILIDMNDILFKLHVRCPLYNHAATFIVVAIIAAAAAAAASKRIVSILFFLTPIFFCC